MTRPVRFFIVAAFAVATFFGLRAIFGGRCGHAHACGVHAAAEH